MLQDIRDAYITGATEQNDASLAMNELLYELAPLLEAVGMNDVFQRVYISAQNHELVVPLLVLFTISQVPRLVTLKSLNAAPQAANAASNSKRDIDASAFIVGVYTLTKQYHSDLTADFLTCLCQYIKSYIIHAGRFDLIKFINDSINMFICSSQKLVDFPVEAVNMLEFLTMYIHAGDLSVKVRFFISINTNKFQT